MFTVVMQMNPLNSLGPLGTQLRSPKVSQPKMPRNQQQIHMMASQVSDATTHSPIHYKGIGGFYDRNLTEFY